MPQSISLCLVVKNEEQLIGTTIRSVNDIVDEVIVVDTGSTDRTVAIARDLGARIIPYQWDGSLGRARNAYLEAAQGDWVLVLDGDESISRRDLPKIEKLVRRRSVIGYCLAIRNYSDHFDLMWNWYSNDSSFPREERFSACHGFAKTQPLRLFRNFSDVRYVEGTSVHTNPLALLMKHAGRIENRDDVVIHHFQSLKGGELFLSGKQGQRLKGELRHSKLFPSDPQTYLNIAKTLFAQGKDDESLKYLARAVNLNRDFHDAYQLGGMIELENGRLPAAAQHLKQAIRVRPTSADAWAILGIVLIEAGKHEQAIDALMKAIKFHPDHLLAHNSLGLAYEELGDYRKARVQYRRALRLNPVFSPATESLARLARKQRA
jgi:glycosyltransferase involved in cell wall biosynthesis